MLCVIGDSLLKDTGEDVKLMLWDTAGQEEYDSLTRTYYRGKGGLPGSAFDDPGPSAY